MSYPAFPAPGQFFYMPSGHAAGKAYIRGLELEVARLRKLEAEIAQRDPLFRDRDEDHVCFYCHQVWQHVPGQRDYQVIHRSDCTWVLAKQHHEEQS